MLLYNILEPPGISSFQLRCFNAGLHTNGSHFLAYPVATTSMPIRISITAVMMFVDALISSIGIETTNLASHELIPTGTFFYSDPRVNLNYKFIEIGNKTIPAGYYLIEWLPKSQPDKALSLGNLKDRISTLFSAHKL